MKRRILYLLSILFLFYGCASVQNVYTFASSDAQTYFIRSTKLKKVPESLKSCEFDITVRTDVNGELLDNPVLNYSFVCNKDNYSIIEDAEISFLCDEYTVKPFDSKKIYKEIDKNKNLTYRCTSKIQKEDFIHMLDCSNVFIVLECNNDSVEQISKEFAQKMAEVEVLIR